MLLLLATSLRAQVVVDGVNINDTGTQFVEIVAMSKFMSAKVTISVDYGQELKLGESQRIEDAQGKAKVFKGVVDALNFMHANGWQYLNNYVVTTGNQNVYHYLFQRKTTPK